MATVDDAPGAAEFLGFLEDLGPVHHWGELVEQYRQTLGPVSLTELRRRLWDDAGIAVDPTSGALVLPADFPVRIH